MVSTPAAPPPVAAFEIARPAEARVAVRIRPGGRVVFHLRRTTAFGSRVVLGVAATRAPWVGLGRDRGTWVGVITSALPNGRIGWIRRRALRLGTVRYSIVVDLSSQTLVVRGRRDRILLRTRAGIGGTASRTPTGTFVVTDELAGDASYGCCILALSGHQPHPPAGWVGGDRLAIHGGPLGANSAGCIHLADRPLRYLMATVPIGTPVTIHE